MQIDADWFSMGFLDVISIMTVQAIPMSSLFHALPEIRHRLSSLLVIL